MSRKKRRDVVETILVCLAAMYVAGWIALHFAGKAMSCEPTIIDTLSRAEWI